MTATAPLLELDRIDRRLAGRSVVRDLSLVLQAGQVLGLLGVNGAGKSTTLAMVAGALRPDSGRIRLNGADLREHPEAVRRGVGWLPEHAPLWPELTVREQLDAAGRLRGLRGGALRKATSGALESLQLDTLSGRLVGILSQGQRQRVGLACALLHAPPLLVLDEPANGLDPLQAGALRALIRERAAQGCGIVLSTHLLPEVTAVCDRVAILHEGRLRHEGPLQVADGALRLGFEQAVVAARVAALATVTDARQDGERGVVAIPQPGRHAADVVRDAVQAGLPLAAVEPAAGTLEQIFLRVATQGDRAEAA